MSAFDFNNLYLLHDRNEHSNASKKFPPIDQATFPTDAVAAAADKTTTPGATGATQHVRSNKENSKPPTEVYIKKTRQYTMLEVSVLIKRYISVPY